MKFVFSALLVVTSFFCYSQSVIGIWKSVDEMDGVEKSNVQIYESNGKVYGKVIKLLNNPADSKCDKCKGIRKDQPVLHMIVIENLTLHSGVYKGGRIYDPESGNDYGCSIWIEASKPNELKVRGKHWSGLYRTQTWYRVL